MSHLFYNKLAASIISFLVRNYLECGVVNKLVPWEAQFVWYNMLIPLYFTFSKQQAAVTAALFMENGKRENTQSGTYNVCLPIYTIYKWMHKKNTLNVRSHIAGKICILTK